MKKLIIAIIVAGSAAVASVDAAEVNSWSCSAQGGLFGMNRTTVRLEKDGNAYSVFLTASSGDVGPQWQLRDALISQRFTCVFSVNAQEPLHCVSRENGWATLTAANIQVTSVDEATGQDKVTQYTSIILSGTSEILTHYQSSVLKFGATTCSRN